jgi:hypothetical protein
MSRDIIEFENDSWSFNRGSKVLLGVVLVLSLTFFIGLVPGINAGTFIDSGVNYAEEIKNQSLELESIAPGFLKSDAEQLTQQAMKLISSFDKYRSNVSSSQLGGLMDVLEDQWSEYGDWREALQDDQGGQLEDTLDDLKDPENFEDRGGDLQALLSGSLPVFELEKRSQIIDRCLERINQTLLWDMFERISEIRREHRTRIARDSLRALHQNYVEDLNRGWELRKISGPIYISLVEQYFNKVTNDSETFGKLEFGYLLKGQGNQLLATSPSNDSDREQLTRLNEIVARLLPGEQQDGPFGALR